MDSKNSAAWKVEEEEEAGLEMWHSWDMAERASTASMHQVRIGILCVIQKSECLRNTVYK